MEDMKKLFEEMTKRISFIRSIFGEENLAAVHLFEECLSYPLEKLVELARQNELIESLESEEEIREEMEVFRKLRLETEKMRKDYPSRLLWPEGNMPVLTEYKENPKGRYNHDPDFAPFLYEMLIPEYEKPKGAIILCAGGDHGFTVLCEGYQVAKDFNKMGYQCFLLLNRTNLNPWSGKEAGADVARAIRMVRSEAERYRIRKDQVVFAGFSNGGLTGEACIQYYSGNQKVKDWFPDYREDELDRESADMDAFLCIYGPRMNHDTFEYDRVVYPPVFHAVGMDDFNMDNINKLYPELVKQGVMVEIHTFAGVPHGQAGRKLLDGYVKYPNFETWEFLADQFIRRVTEERSVEKI